MPRVRYEHDLAAWIAAGLNPEAAHGLAILALKVRS